MVLVFATTGYAQEKQTFPIKWKIGETYTQSAEMQQKVAMPGQGDMEMKMTSAMTSEPKAGAKADTVEVTTTYTAVAISSTMAGQEVPGVADSVNAIVGKSFTAIFNEKGEVVEISGLKDLIEQGPASQLLSEESMKQMITQGGLLGRPDHPVAPGESWDFSFDAPNPMMKMVMKGTYTYEKDEEVEGSKVAKISFEGNVAIEPAGAAEGAMEFGVRESKFSGVSYYHYDMENFSRTESSLTMTMTLKVPGAEEAMEMPMTVSSVQTLAIKK
jgi:hypothetical protein